MIFNNNGEQILVPFDYYVEQCNPFSDMNVLSEAYGIDTTGFKRIVEDIIEFVEKSIRYLKNKFITDKKIKKINDNKDVIIRKLSNNNFSNITYEGYEIDFNKFNDILNKFGEICDNNDINKIHDILPCNFNDKQKFENSIFESIVKKNVKKSISDFINNENINTYFVHLSEYKFTVNQYENLLKILKDFRKNKGLKDNQQEIESIKYIYAYAKVLMRVMFIHIDQIIDLCTMVLDSKESVEECNNDIDCMILLSNNDINKYERLNENLFLESRPDYILDLIINEAENNKKNKSFKEVFINIRNKFNQLIQNAISLFDQLFRNYEKFINSNLNTIKKYAELVKSKYSIMGYKYNIFGDTSSNNKNAMTNINNVIDKYFYNYNGEDVLINNNEGDITLINTKICSSLVNKTCKPSELDKQAKLFIRGSGEPIKLTIDNLGGIDNIIKRVTDCKNIKNTLKDIKSKFNDFMDDINLKTDSETYIISREKYMVVHRSYVLITKFINICLKETQNERNQYFRICKDMCKQKFDEEKYIKSIEETYDIDIIKKAIAEKDIIALREMVSSIIFVDRNFSKNRFYDILNYVNSKLNIMDECGLKGELISDTKTNYSQDDFSKALHLLENNFCYERIEDVKKIGRKLYPIKK